MDIEFLYFPGCPSHEEALARLQAALRRLGVGDEIRVVCVDTEAQARGHAFTGSPTIRINGKDIDPSGAKQPAGLGCRVYFKADGRATPLPPDELIESAIRASGEGRQSGT